MDVRRSSSYQKVLRHIAYSMRQHMANIVLGSLLVRSFLVHWNESLTRPFWFDEILTATLTELPAFSDTLRAIREGADGMSPMFYFIERLGAQLPFNVHTNLRFFPLLGYVAGLLFLYYFLKPLCGPWYPLAAICSLELSPWSFYAADARCYALETGFFMAGAFFWQNYDRYWWAKTLLIPVLFLSSGMHSLGIFAIGSLAVGELSYFYLTRRIRVFVWVSFAVSAIPLLLNWETIQMYKSTFGPYFWSKAGRATLLGTMGQITGISGPLSLTLFGILSLVFCHLGLQSNKLKTGDSRPKPEGSVELFFISYLLACPFLLCLIAYFQGGGYVGRYSAHSVIILHGAAAYLLSKLFDKGMFIAAGRLSIGSLILIVFLSSPKDIYSAVRSNPFVNPLPGSVMSVNGFFETLPGGHPIVCVWLGPCYVNRYYASAALKPRIAYALDADLAIRFKGSNTGELTLSGLQAFRPMTVLSPKQMRDLKDPFYLFAGGDVALKWISIYLQDSARRVETICLYQTACVLKVYPQGPAFPVLGDHPR